MKIFVIICFSLSIFSCNSQVTEKMIFECGINKVEIELPRIIKTQEHQYEEGKITLLTTEDKVLIEFYCGGNYSSHISNKERYKLLYEKGKSKFGVDNETNRYWRKDGKLIYSNCKVEDTLKYNTIFNSKKIVKSKN